MKEKCSRLEEGFCQEVENVSHTAYQNWHSKGYREGYIEGYHQAKIVGAYHCRSYLLMTPAGQAFLDVTRKRIPEDYLPSQDFWDRMQEVLEHWFLVIAEGCNEQLNCLDRLGEINIEPILAKLCEGTPGLKLSIELQWFMPSLTEAAKVLSSFDRDSGNPFPGISFHILFFQPMQENTSYYAVLLKT